MIIYFIFLYFFVDIICRDNIEYKRGKDSVFGNTIA